MRDFKKEQKDYDFIASFVEKGGYTEDNKLEIEIYPENDETDGQNTAFITGLVAVWMNEDGDVVFEDENGWERDLDDFDGTELHDIAFDLKNFYSK